MPTQRTPIPEFTTYYALHVEQEDYRPLLMSRYEDLVTSFAERAYKDTTVKWYVKPVELKSEELRPPPLPT